jgi:hypothetical protein
MASDADDDRKRIEDLESHSRSLDEMIAVARRLRRDVEAHLQSLRRADVSAADPLPDRRRGVPERRRLTRHNRRRQQ